MMCWKNEERRQRREYANHVREIYGIYLVMFRTFLEHNQHIDTYNI